uniref:Carboxylesterase type B domain-containing protein n=1 Tax=Timema genevievae TaxID=629358 RepID=A0A7R9PJR7_TIMGE|nr:unnamed protein product [Timema genevievae]
MERVVDTNQLKGRVYALFVGNRMVQDVTLVIVRLPMMERSSRHGIMFNVLHALTNTSSSVSSRYGILFNVPQVLTNTSSNASLAVMVLTNTSSNASLAVMVFIHGGEFYTGSGCTDLYGPEYLMEEDVVLVTLNYRLGVLGFLGVANSNVSINAGLKDQLAALKWVNENIGNFSGDRSKITLFGQNAGGSSVEYHILSPASKGLFQRAISQSGNAVDPWAFVDSEVAKERALRLGQALGTNATNVDELVQLLQNTPGDELVNKQLQAQSLQLANALVVLSSTAEDEEIEESYKRLYPFVPTLESSSQEGDIVFVTGKPLLVLLSGKYNVIPYITGVNTEEGKLYVMDVIANETLWDEYEETLERFVPNDLGYAWGSSQSVAVAKKIKKFYFNDRTLSNSSLSSLVDLVGDIMFSYPHHTSVLLHVLKGNAPVYVYGFGYDGRLGLTRDFYNFTFPGPAHMDELEYLFNGTRFSTEVEPNSTEAFIREKMVTMWTKFSKDGNPNPDSDTKWNPLTLLSHTYLDITSNPRVALTSEDSETGRMNFWTAIYLPVWLTSFPNLAALFLSIA